MKGNALNVLLEMRPALDGHAGIPQETRLLFRGLQQLDGIAVEGLIQSSNRVLAKGLPATNAPFSPALSIDQRVNRLSRVVVSLQHGVKASRMEIALAAIRYGAHLLTTIAATLLFLRMPLTRFDPQHFKDFLWRAFFAKTLLDADFESATSASFRVARTPWTLLHVSALVLQRLGRAMYRRIDTRGFGVMIAETPYPGRVAQGTRLVVRYHDAIPLLMPHTISDKAYHQASHYQALRRNVSDGAWFACVSDATRRDLISVFPEVENRAVTIHNIVSHHYFVDESSPERIPEIVRVRRNLDVRVGGGSVAPPIDTRRVDGVWPYLLMVSTIEPRKNHLTLLSAWEQLRSQRFPHLHLVLVGSLGWDHKPIVARFRPWLARGGLHMLEDVPATELRLLYRHASATVCPSFGEGFDFSGAEAMKCGGVVVASDIPVHRDIFGDAADFFGTYSTSDLARVIGELIEPAAAEKRNAMVRHGLIQSERYSSDRVLPQWKLFLLDPEAQRTASVSS